MLIQRVRTDIYISFCDKIRISHFTQPRPWLGEFYFIHHSVLYDTCVSYRGLTVMNIVGIYYKNRNDL